MSFTLQHVIPPFLPEEAPVQSEVWNCMLHFESGKYYLIRATSGSGKSTILGYLFGARKGYRGNILLHNEALLHFSNERWSELRQKDLACMFQELRLFETLTVRENLQIKLNVQQKYTLDDATQWLAELDLHNMLDRQVNTLSLGQQQRVALVRTLLQPMQWLLLDEPFSHLDTENTSKCLALILRICKEQDTGIIMTTLGEVYDFPYDHLLKI